MYCMILNASSPTKDINLSYGKDYIFRFWSLGEAVSFVSDVPFSKGDIVEIEETNLDRFFIIKPLNKEHITKEVLQNVGVLCIATTDIPLSIDADYKLEARFGTKILKIIRATSDHMASYTIIAIATQGLSKIIGTDTKYGDKFEFVLDFKKEFNKLKELTNN